MGYENENLPGALTGRPWLVFDIETVPMPDCGEYLTDPIEAPSNYKDPAKIAAYVAEKRQRQIADAGLDLDLCEVAAIAWTLPDADVYCHTRDEASEAYMLKGFWYVVQAHQRAHGLLVGFNCLAFDLPILLRRSLYLGIDAPRIAVDKYRHDGVIDVADVLTFSGKMTWRSLAFYCRRFGIPYDDSVKGEQVAQLVAEGQWEAVASHCRADVAATAALAKRVGLIMQSQVEAVI